MAKTQSEWFERLKGWVPTWFFEKEEYNTAVFSALAKLLSEQEAAAETMLQETFITEATAPYLDVHGDERSVERLTGEFDTQYAVRIQNKSLISQASKPSILAIVNQLLMVGSASIREDWQGGVFFGDDTFLGRGEIVLAPIHNTFTILVDKQVHDPYSFFDREHFTASEDFIGDHESSDYVFQLILNAVNEAKALGVFYGIIERVAA